ncbi:MAG TPA: hypothetical protein VG713_14475 [Pirellulales bacterium]|nr:hypothetical protein [Pirellulales bacterium]
MHPANPNPTIHAEMEKLRQELLQRIVKNEERRKHQSEAAKK